METPLQPHLSCNNLGEDVSGQPSGSAEASLLPSLELRVLWLHCNGTPSPNNGISSLKGLMDHLYLNHLRVSKRLKIFLQNFQWDHSFIFRSQPFSSIVLPALHQKHQLHRPPPPCFLGCILSQLGNTNGYPFDPAGLIKAR